MNKYKQFLVPAIIVLVSIILLISRISQQKSERIFSGDVMEYYLYFPAFIVYGDPNLSDVPEDVKLLKGWTKNSPTGKPVFKFTMGVVALSLPFLLTAHVYCMISGDVGTGFSDPYAAGLLMSTVFYLLVGLFFVRKYLCELFKPGVSDGVILLMFLATNLGYFSFFLPGMSHVFSFAIISAYVFYTHKWHHEKKRKYLLLIGLAMGLMFLIRPVNIVLSLIFIFYGCKSLEDIKIRFVELIKNKQVYFIPLITLILAFPQLLYWKIQAGSWFYYSYGNEPFFFSDPKILETLFSFRNGLLIYSPILFLALFGLFFIKKRLPEIKLMFYIVLPLFIYLLSSWWCWWYIGFGNRAYIDIFVLLALPMAIIVEKGFALKPLYKVPLMLVAGFLIFLSCFQTLQADKGIIHYDGMNRDAYCSSFLKMNVDAGYFKKLTSPDYTLAPMGFRSMDNYDKASNDEVRIVNGNEYATSWTPCAPRYYGFSKNGEYSQKLDANTEYGSTYADTIKNIFAEDPDSISLFAWFYPYKDSTDAFLVFQVISKDSSLFWDARPLKAFQTGKETWQYAKVTIPWDRRIRREHLMKVYVWNRSKEDLFIDDFGFSFYF